VRARRGAEEVFCFIMHAHKPHHPMAALRWEEEE
jgi:hypothetical protein